MRRKVMLVFGTRPEAIKMAPLVKAFKKYPEQFQTLVCVTSQHRELLDQVLDLFEIIPDYDLNIMKQGQDLYDITALVLLGMRDVLAEARPDVVLVHGDTTTSTSAALAAFYQQIPVAHVEAGLRTYDKYSPWPEEMNRQITGRLADLHFAPTPLSKENLLREGVEKKNIFVTGNTAIDALYWVTGKMRNDQTLEETIIQKLAGSGLSPEKIDAWKQSVQSVFPNPCNPRKLVLITGHRRENFGDGFIRICSAIKSLAGKYPDVDFVYPMHLNPNVRGAITQMFGEIRVTRRDQHRHNLFFIEPLEYLHFVYLMEKSAIILTDSGGIQEEAPGLGKPVLVMRETTERPEALEAGTVKLVGTNYHKIVAEVSALLDHPTYYSKMSKASNPYGDGSASERIIMALSGFDPLKQTLFVHPHKKKISREI
jgi:UDP-N-acetylglucosamine 2-epimerase (non-hydrolysing)